MSNNKRPHSLRSNYALIPIGPNAKDGYAKVDLDFAYLDQHNWCLSGDGYPMTWIDGKLIKLHHLVIGKPVEGCVIDHRNRNKFDNRSANLRVVTRQINSSNMTKPITNKSGIVGVCWDNSRGKWLAQIRIDGTQKFLGYFTNKKVAAQIRKEAEAERLSLYMQTI